MLYPFTKMHSLGNDFVLFNAIQETIELNTQKIRALADRRFGIGCDQVLLVQPATTATAHFRYRIFNANGQEVEQCGNGARCLAYFLRTQALTNERSIKIETLSGLITLEILENAEVRVDMGTLRVHPDDLPFIAEAEAPSYYLDLEQGRLEIGAVSIGNPHAVTIVENIDTAEVALLGPLIGAHSRFPQQVNVGFMQIVDRQNIRLRVYERGVGETLACGTGACAAVAVGQIQGLLHQRVTVQLGGGKLAVEWGGGNQSVYMTGPATSVFTGEIDLENL